MAALVTGGNGAVGPRVVALLEEGFTVRTLSIEAPQNWALAEGERIISR